MNWLAENWYFIVLALVIVILAIVFVLNFTKLPVKDRNSKILKFLLGVVIAAEAEFGSKTGQAKLATVYGKFVIAYPFIKTLVSFNTFSKWVDMALDEMKEMIENNPAVKNYIQ